MMCLLAILGSQGVAVKCSRPLFSVLWVIGWFLAIPHPTPPPPLRALGVVDDHGDVMYEVEEDLIHCMFAAKVTKCVYNSIRFIDIARSKVRDIFERLCKEKQSNLP